MTCLLDQAGSHAVTWITLLWPSTWSFPLRSYFSTKIIFSICLTKLSTLNWYNKKNYVILSRYHHHFSNWAVTAIWLCTAPWWTLGKGQHEVSNLKIVNYFVAKNMIVKLILVPPSTLLWPQCRVVLSRNEGCAYFTIDQILQLFGFVECSWHTVRCYDQCLTFDMPALWLAEHPVSANLIKLSVVSHSFRATVRKSRQTRHITSVGLMLVIVFDAGLTLKQHQVNLRGHCAAWLYWPWSLLLIEGLLGS